LLKQFRVKRDVNNFRDMKKSILFIAGYFSFTILTAQQEKEIFIIHTNDMHSRLRGYSPESAYTPLSVDDDNTVSGFSRIAGIISKEKERNEGLTLVVDAGDFLMGTIYQGLEISTGFQLCLMRTMGYDVVGIGNHEFDYGPSKLAGIVNSALDKGDIPSMILSNVVFDRRDSSDNSLEMLFSRGVIADKTVLSRGGLKIGFFSLMGKVAAGNAAFASPVTFTRQVAAARRMVKELKALNCDIIICLSHSGLERDKNGEWNGEDAEMARQVKGINAIISGHTHTRLDKPLIVNGIPIVQAGEYGQYVGRLALGFSNGQVRVRGYDLIPVDDRIKGSQLVDSLVDRQKSLVNDVILGPLALDYEKRVVESDFLLECNEYGDVSGSNLGPLVADAIHGYINSHVSAGVDVSMIAAGVIRDKLVPACLSAPDIFRIMSMGSGNDNIPGYPLAKIHVTGRELKSILEILLVAGNSTPSNYCYYSGIKVDYNPSGGFLRKICRVQVIHPGGKTEDVDFSRQSGKLYSIAANAYMLEFVGIIKKMSFGLINVTPKDAGGKRVGSMKNAVIDIDERRDGLQEGKEWLALMEYFGSMKDLNGNGVPDIDNKYRVAVKTFFPIDER
jgi:5'-nucleotidase